MLLNTLGDIYRILSYQGLSKCYVTLMLNNISVTVLKWDNVK